MFAIANASQQLIVSQMAESPSVQHTPATQPAHLSVAPNQGASDIALVKAIAGGDRRAMQMLYTRHNVRVYRFILRLINDRSLAEDLVSEVFLVVWRQAEGFKAKSEVSTWLLAIARYKALSAIRRRSDEHLDDDVLAMIEDPADDPETLVEKEDRRAIVQNCLAQLSPTHRKVLDLVYCHEKSVNEAAEIVGIPANTVKTRMFYARTRMEKFLKLAGVDAF
jgi:RNA polymerase sigma-70 factor (ECF subfamily)